MASLEHIYYTPKWVLECLYDHQTTHICLEKITKVSSFWTSRYKIYMHTDWTENVNATRVVSLASLYRAPNNILKKILEFCSSHPYIFYVTVTGLHSVYNLRFRFLKLPKGHIFKKLISEFTVCPWQKQKNDFWSKRGNLRPIHLRLITKSFISQEHLQCKPLFF